MDKFEELKQIYKGIYENTFKISSLIEKQELSDIELTIEQRGLLIKKADEIIQNTQFSDEQKKEINSLVEEIRQIEDKNIQELLNNQDKIKQELSKISINHKAITAYKYNKETDPRIIDEKE